MSAKSAIQKLEDSQLIGLFLQFIQKHHFRYQKMSKQISYKCYEATWILVNFKANGYGRTQSEAYKHALRNLLQILIEEPAYTQFFVDALSLYNYNQRPSIKQQSLSQSGSNYAKNSICSKTQGHEPLQKENRVKGQMNFKLCDSYSKNNKNSHSKFGAKVQANYHTKLVEPNFVYQASNLDNGNQKLINTGQSKHSHNAYKTNLDKFDQGSSTQELKKALKKLADLQDYLSNIDKENQCLKKQLHDLDKLSLIQDKQNAPFPQQTQYCQYTEILNQTQFSASVKNRPLIPKLNLQILPNYHKKAQKSLNQSLMAAYNEKRDPSVKKLVC